MAEDQLTKGSVDGGSIDKGSNDMDSNRLFLRMEPPP